MDFEDILVEKSVISNILNGIDTTVQFKRNINAPPYMIKKATSHLKRLHIIEKDVNFKLKIIDKEKADMILSLTPDTIEERPRISVKNAYKSKYDKAMQTVIVRELIDGNKSYKEIGLKYSISNSTLSAYRKQYIKDGGKDTRDSSKGICKNAKYPAWKHGCMPMYDNEQQKKIVAEIVYGGASRSEVCKKYNINPATLSKYYLRHTKLVVVE